MLNYIANMVNFLLTKARRLFDYADLGGSNNNGSIGGTTVTASRPNSESGGSLEAASINMEAAASNGAISDMSAVPRTRRKKCIMATTGIVGLFALILIILVYSGSSPKKLKGKIPVSVIAHWTLTMSVTFTG